METTSLHPRASRMLARAGAGILIILFVLISIPASLAHAAVSSWQQKGVSIYPYSPTDFSSAGFQSNVTHYKNLGFNTITLIIPLSQSSLTSTDVGPAGNAPTDATLVSAIKYIHSQGMQVMFKIHLDPRSGGWRAYINPSDRDTWYANYLAELTHYGQIAANEHVESYCLGTELIHMASATQNGDNTQRWQNMIAQTRKIYSGQLTYDANWGGGSAGEAQYIGFWPSLDFVGISAYYPLYGDGSIAQSKNAWANVQNGELATIRSNAGNRPIVFTEIGYRSVDNAHSAPYDSGMGGSYNSQEQVNDYESLFESFNDASYMNGIDVWYENSNPRNGGPGNTDYLIQGKPVESTFQTWFSGSGSSTPSSSPGQPAQFVMTVNSTPTSPSVGQQVSSNVSINDTGGSVSNTNVDLEVYASNGQRVAQQVYSNQDFAGGQSKSYSISWSGSSADTYTLKTGIFDSAWHLIVWNDSVGKIAVSTTGSTTGNSGGTSTSTPPSTTPPPTNSSVDVWWPTNGATVSGTQPFKALLQNAALSTYQMVWQVDGGQLNEMYDSQTDAPHKEAIVNLSGWTWKGRGPYTLNFIAKNSTGTVLTNKSVSIYVVQ